MSDSANSLMEIARHYEVHDDPFYDDPSSSSTNESDPDYIDSDSDTEPGFDVVEETRSKLSTLSIQKKSKSGADGDFPGSGTMDCDEDEKSLQNVVELIQSGELKKLKIDHCKTYLRKNGLRLSGNKDTLVQRIKEHLEIVNGGAEKKYPVSTFVFNCKGDACTGDIVLFEQNVYEMFNLASRSASGPPCGKRLVAGRIIKESYGSAKQQHTFTIEVLWSKGEKPLPPLYPLLIKGRNLYRMKTLRQKWADEGERQKVLMEKHSRGSLARSIREVRVREKGIRKNLKSKMVSKDTNKNLRQPNKLIVEPVVQPQVSATSFEPRKPSILPQQPSSHAGSFVKSGPPNIHSYQVAGLPPGPTHCGGIGHVDASNGGSTHSVQNFGPNIYSNGQNPYFNIYSYENEATRGYQRQPLTNANNYPHFINGQGSFVDKNIHKDDLPGHRQPLSTFNYSLPVRPQKDVQVFGRKKLCRYYAAQRKCHFGDNCRFLHAIGDSSDQNRRC